VGGRGAIPLRAAAPRPVSGAFATSGGHGGHKRSRAALGAVRQRAELDRGPSKSSTPQAQPAASYGERSGERFTLSADQRRLVEARFPKTRKNSAGYR